MRRKLCSKSVQIVVFVLLLVLLLLLLINYCYYCYFYCSYYSDYSGYSDSDRDCGCDCDSTTTRRLRRRLLLSPMMGCHHHRQFNGEGEYSSHQVDVYLPFEEQSYSGDKVLYDKLSKGEDNKWIQGKGNGECLLDMVGVDAVALGHIMAVNELIKADGTLQRPQTTIINLSAGKGIQYKHMIGSEVEKDGKSYWGQAPAEPVPAKSCRVSLA